MKTNRRICPLYPRKQTCAVQPRMSAMGQQRTLRHLLLPERAQQSRPSFLEVAIPLESLLQQGLDLLLRFRPRQRGLKGVEGVEESVGGWQRDLVNEILRCCDSTPVERSDPAREHVNEAVQLRVRKCPVDVSVSFRGIPVE